MAAKAELRESGFRQAPRSAATQMAGIQNHRTAAVGREFAVANGHFVYLQLQRRLIGRNLHDPLGALCPMYIPPLDS